MKIFHFTKQKLFLFFQAVGIIIAQMAIDSLHIYVIHERKRGHYMYLVSIPYSTCTQLLYYYCAIIHSGCGRRGAPINWSPWSSELAALVTRTPLRPAASVSASSRR